MVLNEQRSDDETSQRFKKFGNQKYTLTYVFYIYMNVNQEHSQKFSKENARHSENNVFAAPNKFYLYSLSGSFFLNRVA